MVEEGWGRIELVRLDTVNYTVPASRHVERGARYIALAMLPGALLAVRSGQKHCLCQLARSSARTLLYKATLLEQLPGLPLLKKPCERDLETGWEWWEKLNHFQ